MIKGSGLVSVTQTSWQGERCKIRLICCDSAKDDSLMMFLKCKRPTEARRMSLGLTSKPFFPPSTQGHHQNKNSLNRDMKARSHVRKKHPPTGAEQILMIIVGSNLKLAGIRRSLETTVSENEMNVQGFIRTVKSSFGCSSS